jgi:hypothetical protein
LEKVPSEILFFRGVIFLGGKISSVIFSGIILFFQM